MFFHTLSYFGNIFDLLERRFKSFSIVLEELMNYLQLIGSVRSKRTELFIKMTKIIKKLRQSSI